MFYVNFNNFNNFDKKENANKFIMFGSLLVFLSSISFLSKDLGVSIISYTIAFLFLFFAYLNLVNINDRKRYQSKEEVRLYTLLQIFLVSMAILFIVFPTKIQAIFSTLYGVFVLYKVVVEFIKNRNNPYYRFSFFKIVSLLFGIILIISPLFLSRFIVSILSFVILIIGINMISFGRKIKKIDIY